MTFIFNSEEVNDVKFEPIAPGDYKAIIRETAIKINKAGNGRYINITYEIYDGNYKGRLVYGIYNIENPSDQSVAIGMSQLKEVSDAINKPKFDENSLYKLNGSKLMLQIGIDSKNPEYNRIKKAYAFADNVSLPTSKNTNQLQASSNVNELLDDELPF